MKRNRASKTWGNTKLFNKCVTRISGERRKAEEIFEELMAKNFQKIIKYIKSQIQKAQKHITHRGTKATIISQTK